MSFKKIDAYFYSFSIFHVAAVLTAMTVTSRMILIDIPGLMPPFYVTGGVFFIPIAFFIQDIVTEIYGYYNSKKMLYVTLVIFILYVLSLYLIALIPCTSGDTGCKNLAIIVNTLPRHTLSFVISMLVGGIINIYALSKLSLAFNKKFLAIRFISSTAIGEAFFQCIAVLISWYGTHSINDILPLALVAYVYKVVFEIVMTPINLYLCNYLKSMQEKEIKNVFRPEYKQSIFEE